jgi:HK97 family phage prohead protease
VYISNIHARVARSKNFCLNVDNLGSGRTDPADENRAGFFCATTAEWQMTKITYIDDRAFHKQAANGELDNDQSYLLRKQFACVDIKAVENEDRTLDFIVSTAAVDRMNDRIMVDGWNLDPFKANPVVLFGHDGGEPPVAKATNIGVVGDNLVARAEFTSKDLYPFGDMIYRMYLEGFMRATSVGFIPKEFDFTEDESRGGGFDFTQQELLEFSAVPVPANPEALIQARSMGIDTAPLKHWAERVLDDWDAHKGMTVGRKTVEQLRKKADPKASVSMIVPRTLQDQLLQDNLDRIRAFTVTESDEGTSTEVQLETTPIPVTPKENVMENLDENAEISVELEEKEIEAEVEDVSEKASDDFLSDAEVDTQLDEIGKLFEDAEDLILDEEVKEYGDLEDILTHMLSYADECFEIMEDPTVVAETHKSRSGQRILTTTAGALIELGNALLGTEEKTAEPEVADGDDTGDLVKSVLDVLTKGSSEPVTDAAPQLNEVELDFDDDVLKELLASVLPEVIQESLDKELKNIRGELT